MEYDELLKDLIDYVEENKQFSYYELKAYARNEKQEWMPLFNNRKTRLVVSEYLRKTREELRNEGVKLPTLYESIKKNRAKYNKPL